MAQAAATKLFIEDNGAERAPSLAVAAALNPEIPDRYEMKYLVPESVVDQIRAAIEPFCVLDPHSKKAANNQYAIQSLYFDSYDLYCYRMSRAKPRYRWKARVRCYGEGESVAPTVFLEVKNKDHSMVKKSRARIPTDGWRERILGEAPKDASLAELAFREKLLRYQVEPTLMVRYDREAWMSDVDLYARVTFDRNIAAQEWRDYSFACASSPFVPLDSRRTLRGIDDGVVVELKCTTAVPRWMTNLATTLGLARTCYSKYCQGVERLFQRDSLVRMLHNHT